MHPYLNPNKKYSTIINIKCKGIEYDDPKEIVDCFAEYFNTNHASGIKILKEQCVSFSKNHFNSFSKEKTIFQFENFEDSEIRKALANLKSRSSAGSCGIEAVVFKECSESLTAPIRSLFNLCLEKSSLPDEWKEAAITPIYKKKGSRQEIIDLYQFCLQ